MRYDENNEVQVFYFYPFIPVKKCYLFVWKVDRKYYLFVCKVERKSIKGKLKGRG